MSKRLYDIIGSNFSLSLAGMCKNAGKTTVLNHIIREMDKHDVCLGITSIGRDGEIKDVVTGTQKPSIYVKAGTMLATAAGLLANCDVTREILVATGIQTPLGEIILIRAVSDGYIDLAGPSMNQQLVQVSRLFEQYSVDKIIIDGAISRKSLCSRQVAQSVILCTGASYHSSMDTVVADTRFICDLLQLKQCNNPPLWEQVANWQSNKNEMEKYLFLEQDGSSHCPPKGSSLADGMREKKLSGLPFIWIEGALTDGMIKPLLLSNISLQQKTLLIADSSKILLSRSVCEKLYRKGASILVAAEIKLLAVAVNPFSAYGVHFDKDVFRQKMESAVSLPVLDVMEEEK